MKPEEKYKTLRVYEKSLKHRQFDRSTPCIWIDDRNIEDSLNAIQEFDYKHIHIQTFSLDFLSDRRLSKIKGMSIQMYIQDLSPFYKFNLSQLTHLGLPESIEEEFDFSWCPNIDSLTGRLPDKYKNFTKLKHLKYVRISNYRKKDLSEFKGFKELKELYISSLGANSLNGIEDLVQLKELFLSRCPRLVNLDGIAPSNTNLTKVDLEYCWELKNVSKLSELPNLKYLRLYEIFRLDSFDFLANLNLLEDLRINPDRVGVYQNNYYPLIEKLKRINNLSSLNRWDELHNYLNGEIDIRQKKKDTRTRLRIILSMSPILSWVRNEDDEYYWEIYSAENCNKAQQILVNLVNQLESGDTLTESQKVNLFKKCILGLNSHDKKHSGFIETVEREELCDFFDKLSHAAGIDVLNFDEGIADLWRKW